MILPTSPATRRPSACGCSETGAPSYMRLGTGSREPGTPAPRSRIPDPDSDFRGPARHHRALFAAAAVVRRSVERVRAGCRHDALFDVGRRARLLPPIGESGWPARPAAQRLSRRSTRCGLGCRVHGIAADEFLAGFRRRLVARAAVRARGDLACASGRPRIARCEPHHAAVGGRAG